MENPQVITVRSIEFIVPEKIERFVKKKELELVDHHYEDHLKMLVKKPKDKL